MHKKGKLLSKSSNPKVLAVYELTKKNHISDYYDMGIGGEELFRIVRIYSKQDWKELELDIEYWSIKQLEQLIKSIMNLGEDFLEEESPTFPENYKVILGFFNLIITLIEIGIKMEQNMIRAYMAADFEFIELYAPILAKYDDTVKTKLEKINHLVPW